MMDKIPQICLGCGAPLHGPVCEFCGREYDLNKGIRFTGKLSENDRETYIDFFGVKLRAYLTSFELSDDGYVCADTLGDRQRVRIHSSPTITLTFEGKTI